MKAIILILALTGCASIPVQKPTQKPPVAQKGTCEPPEWCASYAPVILEEISEELLAYNPGKFFCPNWKNVNKTDFVLQFEKSIIETESSFDPSQEYPEDFDDDGCGYSTGQSISTGLFQLSYGDRCVYPTTDCKKLTPKSLKDPETNLRCGMQIQTMILRKNGQLLDYWSSLNPNEEEGGTGPETRDHLKANFPECFQKGGK
jgi:hypothetical protein